jgi:hypothetical protein
MDSLLVRVLIEPHLKTLKHPWGLMPKDVLVFKTVQRFKAKFKPVTEAILRYLQCDWLLISMCCALPYYLGHLLLMNPSVGSDFLLLLTLLSFL